MRRVVREEPDNLIYPGGETDIISPCEGDVPGSSPGWGAEDGLFPV